MIRLRNATISRYRHVTVPNSLDFSDGANILLGKNGSGKTTLLDLLVAMARCDFTSLHGPFEFEYTIDLAADVSASIYASSQPGESTARKAMPSLPAPQRIALKIALRTPDREYRSESDANRNVLYCDDEEIHVGPALMPISNALAEAFQPIFGNSDHAALSSTVLEHYLSAANVLRFDEGTRTFERIVSSKNEGAHVQYLQSLDIVWPQFFPKVLANLIRRFFKATPDQPTLHFTAAEVPFLHLTVLLLGFKDAKLQVSLISKRPDEDASAILRYGVSRFFFELSDGTVITDESLSYGQRRLLAFLFYTECNEGPIIADELVNGLHHDWIEACTVAIADRQSFLSSQNPLLLDCLGFDSEEHARKTFLICEVDKSHLMSWRKMTPDESQGFFRAYEAGIQQVGEILRTRGLW